MIGSVELQVIKQYIRQHKYQYIYDLEPTAGIKTKTYMESKGLTPELLSEVILRLSGSECYFKGKDDNPRYDDGIVYKFHKNYWNDDLYVKVKVPYDLANMLIFSIHRWNEV